MAEVKNCLGIRGRVGDFVLYRLGGKTFLRKRAKQNDSNTEEQRAVRARFRTAVRFYQKLKETPLDEVLDIAAQGICVRLCFFHEGEFEGVWSGREDQGLFTIAVCCRETTEGV